MKAVVTLLVLTAFALMGCSEPQMQSVSGFAQGTTYTVSFLAEPALSAKDVQSAVRDTLEQIDQELSNYRDDSAIEQFNATATTSPIAVPPSLVELVEVAAEVKRLSDGCYDLTIRPLFDLWGFGAEFRVPVAGEIRAALQNVGMEKLSIVDGEHLAKQNPRLAVDVSSIAQGYTTAKIGQTLEELGIQDYLVEVGGELLVQGAKPDGEPWRVAVERPLPGERAIQKIIEITPGGPMSVITSGTYRHYFDQDNTRYSHILDARTGAPVQHNLLSVTVVQPDPTLADAWATALLCLGTEQALAVAEAQDLAVILIKEEGEELREIYSSAFNNARWSIQGQRP